MCRKVSFGYHRALLVAVAFGTIFSAADAWAVIVSIEYYDRAVVNPEFAGGPLWTGHVDTSTDTLTIETWSELPLHGSEFWIPRNIESQPLEWRARDTDGNLYNVPDTFDGHIDSTFAFVSDKHLREMEWSAPVFDYSPLDLTPPQPPVLIELVDAQFTLDVTDIWPGWGGYAQLQNVNGNIVRVYETAQTAAGQPAFDEHIMPALPVQANAYTWSTDATITAVVMPLEPYPIPEARQWLSILAALSIVLALRWFANRYRAAMSVRNGS